MGLVDSLITKLTSCVLTCPLTSLFIAVVLGLVLYIMQKLKPKGRNPFNVNSVRPKEGLENDLKKRDAVLKQGFTSKKVPEDLDAIVVGSGIGGLSCAALLAKAGRKVLVLEQHDQAGGCCHTFIEKGFEFDVGIHYIGECANNTLTHTFVNQITEGQLEWAPVGDVIDKVELGTGKDRTTHLVTKGKDNFKAELKKSFPAPEDQKSIDQFFIDMGRVRRLYPQTFIFKIIPLWLSRFLLNTGIFNLFSDLPYFSNLSLADYLDSLTKNKRLQGAVAYSYGDYGTQPRESSAMMQLMLLAHYMHGGYYPVGGASEIAYNIIPVIEKAGGKVLVRAPVTEIVLDSSGKAIGVKVKKGGEEHFISAPMVISGAGVINTFEHMIKDQKSRPESLLKKVNSGHGAVSIFAGLDGTNEELKLENTNTWAMAEPDLDKGLDDFLNTPAEKVGTEDIPLLFISFPSTKDPTWDQRFPGKSNCTIVTLGNWKWFEEWEEGRVGKRGQDYDELKTRLAERAWEQACRFYPQIKDKRVYFDVGTPLTNKYYIGSPRGEIYGLDHNLNRFNLSTSAELRPTTSIDGLYLTGQDISTCGFAGGLYAGLLTAAVILNRNLMSDLVNCTKATRKLAAQRQKKN
ncbi:all-trans-retinol 13,14-reductase-like [Clytia hemisphaerica]|uniref:Amine oxidase domain-containing protein n=1 Tax=Clytia hemisphaerica TaxID=252671 RepID=A0A7M5UX67_9CNID|eukprot:TCONS_00001661-protein